MNCSLTRNNVPLSKILIQRTGRPEDKPFPWELRKRRHSVFQCFPFCFSPFPLPHRPMSIHSPQPDETASLPDPVQEGNCRGGENVQKHGTWCTWLRTPSSRNSREISVNDYALTALLVIYCTYRDYEERRSVSGSLAEEFETIGISWTSLLCWALHLGTEKPFPYPWGTAVMESAGVYHTRLFSVCWRL